MLYRSSSQGLYGVVVKLALHSLTVDSTLFLLREAVVVRAYQTARIRHDQDQVPQCIQSINVYLEYGYSLQHEESL